MVGLMVGVGGRVIGGKGGVMRDGDRVGEAGRRGPVRARGRDRSPAPIGLGLVLLLMAVE